MVALSTLLALGCAFFANTSAHPVASSSVDVVDVAHEVMCLTADGSLLAACSVGKLVASVTEVTSISPVASITPMASVAPMAVIVPMGGTLPSAGISNMASVTPAATASSPAKVFPTASLFPPSSRSPLAVMVPTAGGSPTGYLLPVSSPCPPASGSPVAFVPSMASDPHKVSPPSVASTPPTTSVSQDDITAPTEETIIPSVAAPSGNADISTTQNIVPPVVAPTDHVENAPTIEKPPPAATPSGKDKDKPEVKDTPPAPKADDHKDDPADKKKPLSAADLEMEGLDGELFHRMCCVFQWSYNEPVCESNKCAMLITSNSGGIILSEPELPIYKTFSERLTKRLAKREPSGATDVKDIPTPVKGHRTTLPSYLWNTPCARCTSDQCPTSCPFPVDDDHKGHGNETKYHNEHDDQKKDDRHKKGDSHKKDDRDKTDDHHKKDDRHNKDQHHEKAGDNKKDGNHEDHDNNKKHAMLETTSTSNRLEASKRATERKDDEKPHAYVRVAQDGGAMNNPGPHPPKGWLSSVIPLGDTMSPKARHELELKEKAKAEAAAAENLGKQKKKDDLGKTAVDKKHEDRRRAEHHRENKTHLNIDATEAVEKRGHIERHRDHVTSPAAKDINDVVEDKHIDTADAVESMENANHAKRDEGGESDEYSPDIKNVESTERSENTEIAEQSESLEHGFAKRELLEWVKGIWEDFTDKLEELGLKDSKDVNLEQRSLQGARLEPRGDEFAPDYSGKDIEIQEKDFFTRKYVHEDVRPQTLGELGGTGLGLRMCCKCPPGKCPILCKGTVCTQSEDYHRKGMTLSGTRAPPTPRW